MFKGIIFDFDGTLADTMPLAIEAFRRALHPVHGRMLADEEIKASFGPTERGTMPVLAPGLEEATLAEYYRHYTDLHSGLITPFQGIHELLVTLSERRVRLGIVTGKGETSLTISLEHIGLNGVFESIEVGCDDRPCKPLGIARILAEWGLAGDDVLYVGDAPSDVPAAREAGVPIAAVAWADPSSVGALRDKQPDWLFETVESFRDWILKD
ncbi:MAG TPA: HAD family hydrolase [Fimbriimonadaceae bacterium]|jgi:phosphoglycolate phosphatase/pyrophosphatase PpaX